MNLFRSLHSLSTWFTEAKTGRTSVELLLAAVVAALMLSYLFLDAGGLAYVGITR